MTSQQQIYAARRKAGLCTITTCKRKCFQGCGKCKSHLEAARDRGTALRRDKGVKPLAEHRAAGGARGRPGRSASESAARDAKLAAIPVCACGIRHLKCDMEERRIEIRTQGLGAWA